MKHKEISSIQWLIEKYTIVCGLGSKELMKEHIDRANAMHKEEIMEAHYAPKYGCFSEQYYKETFGGDNK